MRHKVLYPRFPFFVAVLEVTPWSKSFLSSEVSVVGTVEKWWKYRGWPRRNYVNYFRDQIFYVDQMSGCDVTGSGCQKNFFGAISYQNSAFFTAEKLFVDKNRNLLSFIFAMTFAWPMTSHPPFQWPTWRFMMWKNVGQPPLQPRLDHAKWPWFCLSWLRSRGKAGISRRISP